VVGLISGSDWVRWENERVRGGRVLLSEGSSLSAREFVTVLGRSGVDVEVASPVGFPVARFSRWCRAVRRVPAPGVDPAGYLGAIDRLLATGRYTTLLATHEQAWLFAVGRGLLPHAAGRLAVAPAAAFDQVQSKLAFARLCDRLGIPQPAWREVRVEADLDGCGFPVWVKAAWSTAGRGVRLARSHTEATAAYHDLRGGPADRMGVMVQAPAPGVYRQVAALFDRGRLVAAACSQQAGVGAGGSAAARLSVADPAAVACVEQVGRAVSWHGGLTCDYFADQAGIRFIECNPRTVEPGNAAAAGVNLPALTIALATGRPLAPSPVVGRVGARTHSTMALALGAAEHDGTRRAIFTVVARAALHRGVFQHSREVLTPIAADPPSLLAALVSIGTVLARPTAVVRLAGRTVDAYTITPASIARLRAAGPPA